MKLTSGVDFINIVQAAFICAHHQSTKRYRQDTGNNLVNKLMKSTPGVNFINVLLSAFMLIDPESVKNTVKSSSSITFFQDL